MILGLGSDIVAINRIERILSRHGERFIRRVFTDGEKAACFARCKTFREQAAFFAKRFAAKEACAKALGTGFRNGIFLRDIEVTNLPSGQPALQLHHMAKETLQHLSNEKTAFLHLTISDDEDKALAVTIISST